MKFLLNLEKWLFFYAFRAAELMTRTGPVVTLEVAKQGAIYNGLSDLLSKPSPIIQRGRKHAFWLWIFFLKICM